MQAHFGKQAAQGIDGLQFDFTVLKHEYRNYEKWHPKNGLADRYRQGYEEQQIHDMIGKLKTKT